MATLKTVYFFIGYTLYFFRWMVIGRVLVLLLSGGRRNVLVDFFVRFTQPLIEIVRKIFPFTRVPPEKQGTAWGLMDGLVPFVTIALLWLIERGIRVLVSYIILN
jgi:hypothetical protein